MTLTATERLHLRKTINELKSFKAPHTEFVTVYIPKDYELFKIVQHLAEEQGTASNIKSASTRKNVQGALEKMIQHLRGFPKTPPNGLAVFSGNIAANEGKQDFRVWSVEPPAPLNVRIYRCDKNFVTDILEEIMVDHNVYGLVVLDRRDAILALLKGKSIVPLQKTHSEVPGKFKAGGQSAQRFARIREGAYKDHFKKISEYMKNQFLPLGNTLKGIIVGGPGTTVNDFLQKEFFNEFRENPKKVTYGETQTLRALDMNAVGVLLLSESMPEDKIFELEERAQKGGAVVKIISTETREGTQLKELGGIAAILRYEIEQS